jgi:hypothetical protein
MAVNDGATFTDAEDFVAALQEARIELVVTSPGLFRARLTAWSSHTCTSWPSAKACRGPPTLR